ncbi:MAG: DUF2806 domain-containing protein [Caldilineaceae bacterium SB0665_bin_25]|nr:DUF2806 domain-containing protein [Caldilineaceae bacterium SB0665_bin_25]
MEVKAHEPDPDWTAMFGQYTKDVSKEKLQSWWSRILAGEIISPGQTSIRTLGVLRDMTQQDAERFQALTNYVINQNFIFYSSDFRNRFPISYFVQYSDFQHLSECRLIIFSSTSTFDIIWSDVTQSSLSYGHSNHLLIERMQGSEGRISTPAQRLTTAGKELYQVSNPKTHEGYLRDLSTFLRSKNCKLHLLKNSQVLPGGKIKYAKKIPIETTVNFECG